METWEIGEWLRSWGRDSRAGSRAAGPQTNDIADIPVPPPPYGNGQLFSAQSPQ